MKKITGSDSNLVLWQFLKCSLIVKSKDSIPNTFTKGQNFKVDIQLCIIWQLKMLGCDLDCVYYRLVDVSLAGA